MDILSQIKEEIHQTSWFRYEEDIDDDCISLSTRDNGNVGDETPGREDQREAWYLKRKLEEKYPVDVEVEEVDEWVIINVILK
jgi:hypothetical protein